MFRVATSRVLGPCYTISIGVVQVQDPNQLQNFVDHMKHVGDVLNVTIRKYGDLQVQISTTLIRLGSEFQRLSVIGEKSQAPVEDRNLSAQARSERAMLD